MREIMPVVEPVDHKNGIDFYRLNGGLCMPTKSLGKYLGYKNPSRDMGLLFKRFKVMLGQHRLLLRTTNNIQGGRPSYFYNEAGILKAIVLAGTPKARTFGPILIDYLVDKLWKKKYRRPNMTQEEKTALREQVEMLKSEGLGVRAIGRRLNRPPSVVCNLIKYGNTSGRIVHSDGK